MTNNEATKALDLLNAITDSVKLQNGIDITDTSASLRLLLQKVALTESGNKAAAKLLPLVTAYLKKVDKSRPALQKINFDKNGRQFIIDGYTAYIFNGHRAELDILPQEPHSDLTININQICNINTSHECSKEDDAITAAVWANIGKYKAYLKSINAESKYNEVYIFGRVFNSAFIETATKICGDLGDYELYSNAGDNNPIKLISKNIEAIILPIRPDENHPKTEIKARTIAFLETIKE